MNTNTINAQAVSAEVQAIMDAAVSFTAEYVKAHSVPASEVPAFMRGVVAAMVGKVAPVSVSTSVANSEGELSSAVVAESASSDAAEVSVPKFALSKVPVVPVEESVHSDGIICLFDGVKKLMLKRHLRARYGMEWEEYLAHFNLPANYPSVAPGYSKEKRLVALEQGLGSKIDKTPRALREAKKTEEAVARAA